MDHLAYQMLKAFAPPFVKPIQLSELEAFDSRLLDVRGSRSVVEYYFTCTPQVPMYILKSFSDVDLVTYIDADMYFVSKPDQLFAEISGCDVGIVAHRFAREERPDEPHGKFNVGILCFRNGHNALEVLNWWRNRCLEWCFDRVEEGRFGDQKYLDDWPTLFQAVHVIRHPGVNVAPWNAIRYMVTSTKDGVFVDGEPLICFHVQALSRQTAWLYDLGFWRCGAQPSATVLRHIYEPYIASLRESESRCRALAADCRPSAGVRLGPNPGRGLHKLVGRAEVSSKLSQIAHLTPYIGGRLYVLPIPTWIRQLGKSVSNAGRRFAMLIGRFQPSNRQV